MLVDLVTKNLSQVSFHDVYQRIWESFSTTEKLMKIGDY